MDLSSKDITVTERGTYQVMADDGQCSTVSNEISVEESSFPVEMLPADQSFIVCDQVSFELMINDGGRQSRYEWYFAEREGMPEVRLEGNEENSLKVPETGYYYAIVTSGVCQQETLRKHVTIKSAPEIFVPNIFTPNGDNYNDIFKVESNMDVLGFQITNRYGKNIFSSGKADNWSGEGSPAGVYYWHVTYRTCIGETMTAKGFVHLIR